ncbi:MAG: HAMP domain-containing histidine kinase [Deltaproteobacteria bacterium]|nr:HAMP domain-containing histidine kinase [Deltaproteobacteria bacterium]
MLLIDTGKRPENPFNQEAPSCLEWGAGFWMNLFDQLDSPVLVYEAGGRLAYSNGEANRLLGLEGKGGGVLPECLSPLTKGAEGLEMYDRGREVTVSGVDGGGTVRFVLKNVPGGRFGNLILAAGLVGDGRGVSSAVGKDRFGDESMAIAGEVSQKVKGPLAGIELYASILGEELEEREDGDLAAIIDGIRYGVREVNEYLTSFESMTGPLSLDLKPHNLAEAIDEALEALKGVFKSKGIGVLVEQKDLVVEIDKNLMVQTFLNILLNAADAMPDGGRLSVRLELNRKGEVEVIFTDTGPGVSFEDSRRIFNPFYTTKKQPLGLGLPVSRRIVEAHQGRITVGQDDPTGARIKVVIPRIPGDSPAPGGLN